MPTTIKDVAKRASVSIATVSNYINNTKKLRKETALRIQKAIDELNYEINTTAKRLKTKEKDEVGVILPFIHDSYYAQILRGIEKVMSEKGFYLNIGFSNEEPEKENYLLNKFYKKDIGGLIITTCQPDNSKIFTNKFQKKKIPMVLIDRKIENFEENLIAFDNFSTIKYIVNELIRSGHKKIALLSGPESYYSEKESFLGYKSAFLENDLKYNETLIVQTNLFKEHAFRSTIEILSNNSPDSVIATSTFLAKGVVEAAYLKGKSIGDELIVLALGQQTWNSYGDLYGIQSSMRTPFRMGIKVADTLIQNMNSPILFEKKKIILNDRLVEKGLGIIHENKQNYKNIYPIKKDKIRVLMLKGTETKPIEGLLPHFENNHGINVEIDYIILHDLLDMMIKDSIQKKYDVFMYDIPWLDYLASNGILRDIKDLIEVNEISAKDYIHDSITNFATYNEGVYGLPFIYAPQLLFYRKDFFESESLKNQFENIYNHRLAPPKNWLEFNAIARFFTKEYNKKSPIDYGTSVANSSFEYIIPEFLIRLWAYGGKMFDNDTINIDTDEFRKALSVFKETFKYIEDKNFESSLEKTVFDFSQGKTAMLVSYAMTVPDMLNIFKSNITGKIGYDFVPGNNPVLGGWSLGISSNSAKTDLAFQFINWACGKEISNYFTILKGQSPLAEVYRNDELATIYPWLKQSYDTYNISKLRKYPIAKKMSKFIQRDIQCELMNLIKEAVTHDADFNKLIKKYEERLKKIII